jgi:5-methylcytosine-specific restriction endonuclease McrA
MEKVIGRAEIIIPRGIHLESLVNKLVSTENHLSNIVEQNGLVKPKKKGNRYRETKYREYIQSDLWKQRSRNYREKREGVCENCHREMGVHKLETHHIFYKKNLVEDDNEKCWLAVCQECHERIHDDLSASKLKKKANIKRIYC